MERSLYTIKPESTQDKFPLQDNVLSVPFLYSPFPLRLVTINLQISSSFPFWLCGKSFNSLCNSQTYNYRTYTLIFPTKKIPYTQSPVIIFFLMTYILQKVIEIILESKLTKNCRKNNLFLTGRCLRFGIGVRKTVMVE